MNVDVGGARGAGGRVAQGAGQAGGASAGVSPGPRGGGAASPRPASPAAAEARVMWAAFFIFYFFSSSLQFTWEGWGDSWSSQSGNGLLFAYSSGFFPLSLL